MKRSARVRAKAQALQRLAVRVGYVAGRPMSPDMGLCLVPVEKMDSTPGDWERRLINWALWVGGGRKEYGELGYVRSAYALTAGRRCIYETVVPIITGEAIDTDNLIKLLPEHLRLAVQEWYGGKGTRTQQLEEAGCENERTFKRRVHAAKSALETLDTARRKASRAI